MYIHTVLHIELDAYRNHRNAIKNICIEPNLTILHKHDQRNPIYPYFPWENVTYKLNINSIQFNSK